MSCELVCVCVSLVRVVIICPASTHTALVSSPSSLAVLHLSTYLLTDSRQNALPTYLSPGRAAKRKKMNIGGTYLLQGPFGRNKTNLPTYLGGASQCGQTPYPARSPGPEQPGRGSNGFGALGALAPVFVFSFLDELASGPRTKRRTRPASAPLRDDTQAPQSRRHAGTQCCAGG